MSTVIKSLNSFSRTLKNNSIKGNRAKIIDNELFSKNGSGSFILDFLTRGKISKNQGYKRMQRKLSDIDMKIGGKAYDYLDKKKSKLSKGLKNSLVQEHDILKKKGKNGLSDEYIKINRAGITNPIAKTKNKVLPFVGAATVGSALMPQKKENNEGDYNYGYD